MHWSTRFSWLCGGIASAVLLLTSPPAFAVTIATWDNDSAPDNKWDKKQNWSGDKKPSKKDDVAIFTGLGNPGIEFTKNAKVGEVRYDSTTTGYNITGSKTLTFDVSSGSAALNVLSTNTASHEIGVKITLSDNLVIDHQGAGELTLSGTIAGSKNVTKTGSGSVTLSGSNTYTGTTEISAGTLALGADDVFADTNNVTVSGGTFDIGSHSDTIDALSIASGSITGDGSLNVNSFAYTGGTSDINVEIGFSGTTDDLTLDNATTDVLTVRKRLRHHRKTRIRKGRLKLAGQGSVADSSAIEISSGAVLDVSETDSGGITLESGQVLSGAGTVTGDLTVATGSTISPGESPGTLTTGNQTWEDGGLLLVEIDDATGTAGSSPGWDLLDIVGTLVITADSSNPFIIDVNSLLVGTNTAGDASNFTPSNLPAPYAWTIATTTLGITGFSEDSFQIDHSGFTNPLDPVGLFAVKQNGLDIVLSYVPEPGTGMLVLAGLLALSLHRKP